MPAEIQIDLDKLKSFMRLKPTLEHTASFFDCTERTIERFVKKHFNQTFFEFRDRQMNNTRHALVQTAISEALGAKDQTGKVIRPVNTALMIFSLKNLCDWSDRNDIQHQTKEDNLIFIDENGKDDFAIPVEDASKTD